MRVRKFNTYLADLDPRFGSEPGKTRPVVAVQTNLLNDAGHPSTIVCPVSSRLVPGADILRVRLARGEGGLTRESDILVDQIRAIDNRRLIRRLGELSPAGRSGPPSVLCYFWRLYSQKVHLS